jgi:hypothetical protein
MRVELLLCAATLWMAAPSIADAYSINVLDSAHTVALRDWTYYDGALTETTRTTTNTAPVTDEYLVPYRLGGAQGGIAYADIFEVSTWTLQGKATGDDGSLQQIWAYAKSELTFTPYASGTASIDVTFLLGGYAQIYSESMVRLVDLTTGNEVWAVGWAYRDQPSANALAVAPTSLATQLDASHFYQLALFARTDARDDWESLTVRVTGLEAVPEPSTLLLVGFGVSAVAIKRRRRSKP